MIEWNQISGLSTKNSLSLLKHVWRQVSSGLDDALVLVRPRCASEVLAGGIYIYGYLEKGMQTPMAQGQTSRSSIKNSLSLWRQVSAGLDDALVLVRARRLRVRPGLLWRGGRRTLHGPLSLSCSLSLYRFPLSLSLVVCISLVLSISPPFARLLSLSLSR